MSPAAATSVLGHPSLKDFGAPALPFLVASSCSRGSGCGRGHAEVLGEGVEEGRVPPRLWAPPSSSWSSGAFPGRSDLNEPGDMEEAINHHYLLFLM